MRARVAEVAAELGYTPNPMVSALMTSLRSTRKTKFVCNLGFITSFPTRDGWKENPSFARYFLDLFKQAHLALKEEPWERNCT
jgi:DNA-binding LacI/PurR family transcriptional regulator